MYIIEETCQLCVDATYNIKVMFGKCMCYNNFGIIKLNVYNRRKVLI